MNVGIRLFSIYILLMSGVSSTLFAQEKNWKKLQSEAQNFEKAGDLTRAAIYYESAFNQNNTNIELAYKAGECYLRTRDYASAAKNLAFVKGENANTKFNKPGFKHALALKQMGEYDKARAAFKGFISDYSGADKDALKARVDAEIQGCTFAEAAVDKVDGAISLVHLSPAINTDKDEFGPAPLRGEKLYFSSTAGGTAKVYAAEKSGETWSNRQEFEPSKAVKGNFCNGSFTPDGKRFYYTQCTPNAKGVIRCELFVAVEENGKWSAAQKLPDYINLPNASCTHPSVVVENEQEIIYFATDREGGKGGYDIWYTSRMVKTKGQNYTLPKNLGNNINTDADEVTPFYDLNTGTLFFSSNGHVSAGGLDVFKSKGNKTQWEVAQNMGFPVNSSADDFYYVLSPNEGGGYIVSNRTMEGGRVATTNDDIFFFGEQRIQLIVKGNIYDGKDANKLPLKDVNVKLFEMAGGSEELVQDRMLAVAEYKFVLEANKRYLIEINADGFNQATFEVATYSIERSETRTNDIAMQDPGAVTPVEEEDPFFVIVPEEYNSAEKSYTLPSKAVDAKKGTDIKEGTHAYDAFIEADAIAKKSPERKLYWDEQGTLKPVIPQDVAVVSRPEVPVDTTHHEHFKETEELGKGKYYMIQVAAVRQFKDYKYKELTLGQMSKYELKFETIEMNITRVFVIPKDKNEDGTRGFKRKSDALNTLYHILNQTRFTRAFVVEYDGEERTGEGFRGMNDES